MSHELKLPKPRSKKTSKKVYVWCLMTPSGRLTSKRYAIGLRDTFIPEWWPTKSEAETQLYELPVGSKAVKVEFRWHLPR